MLGLLLQELVSEIASAAALLAYPGSRRNDSCPLPPPGRDKCGAAERLIALCSRAAPGLLAGLEIGTPAL